MSKSHSIFFKLMTPIFIITVLLLFSAAITVSEIYTDQTKKAAISSNIEILNQTDTSLSLVHEHMAKIAFDIQSTPYLIRSLASNLDSITEEWNARQNLGKIFTQLPAAMVDYEVIVAGKNGIAVGSGNGGVTLKTEELFSLSVLKKALNSGGMAYSGNQKGFTFLTQHVPVIYGCKALKGADGTLCGMLMLIIPEKSLRQFYQSFSNRSTNILILSSEGEILSSNITKDIGTTNRSLLKIAENNRIYGKDTFEESEHSIVLSRYMKYYDVYIISQITSSVLLEEFWPKFSSSVIIAAAMLLLMVVSFLIIRRNLLPLKTLADSMDAARGIPSPVSFSRNSVSLEIQRIASSYNQMIKSLNNYVREIEEIHDRRRQDELDLLQMQINPHFLYNTLDSVKHMVEMKNSSDACVTIDSLISLFRSTLNKTNEKVTVSEELINVKNYISILSPRYGGLISADIEATEDCMNMEIPNLLLQPLVENAFFHAFQHTKSGSIHIFIFENEGKLYCDITDTGDGMSKEKVDQLMDNRSIKSSGNGHRIGISNVRERLSLLYPQESSFEIISELGYGTHIMISFPSNQIDKRKSTN